MAFFQCFWHIFSTFLGDFFNVFVPFFGRFFQCFWHFFLSLFFNVFGRFFQCFWKKLQKKSNKNIEKIRAKKYSINVEINDKKNKYVKNMEKKCQKQRKNEINFSKNHHIFFFKLQTFSQHFGRLFQHYIRLYTFFSKCSHIKLNQ